MKDLQKKTADEICQKLSQMQPSDILLFLRAFLTPKELMTLCERYELVRLLVRGLPQREISEKLGVSISQISRGSAELQFGAGAEIFPKIFPQDSEK